MNATAYETCFEKTRDIQLDTVSTVLEKLHQLREALQQHSLPPGLKARLINQKAV